MAESEEFHEGIRLGAFRKAKKISQQEMAEILGCSQPNLSKIEKGITGISSVIRNNVLDHFPELNPNWLLRGTGDMMVKMISMDIADSGEKTLDSLSRENIIENFKTLTSLLQKGEIPTVAISSIIENMANALKIQEEFITELKREILDLKSDKEKLFEIVKKVKNS